MLALVHDGPVNKPQFWNMGFVKKRNELEHKLKESTDKANLIKQELIAFKNKLVNIDFVLVTRKSEYVFEILIFFISPFRTVISSGGSNTIYGYGS